MMGLKFNVDYGILRFNGRAKRGMLAHKLYVLNLDGISVAHLFKSYSNL